MARDEVRIGLIGAGGIFRSRHLPNLSGIAGARLVAVANRTVESGRRLAEEFKIPHVEGDWRSLVARSDVDAVFIGTWPYLHKELSVAALAAGKHVFCQARMAMDLAEARAMLEAAQARPGLVHMVCPPPHRMPFEPFVRHALASGRLGDLTAVSVTGISGANLDREQVTWRERAELSGKQVLAMGILAETLNAWVGPYESLSATMATPIASKRDGGKPVPIAIPQVVTIQGRLRNGAVAVEQHLGLAADKSSVGDAITLWGLRGTLRHRFLTDTVEMAAAGEELRAVEVSAEHRRPWMVEEDFIAAVRAAREGRAWSVSPDFAEGVEYMKKVEAVHVSAASGRAVRLSEL